MDLKVFIVRAPWSNPLRSMNNTSLPYNHFYSTRLSHTIQAIEYKVTYNFKSNITITFKASMNYEFNTRKFQTPKPRNHKDGQ